MATYHVQLKAGIGTMDDIDAHILRQSSTGDYEFFTTSTDGKDMVAAVPKENVLYIVQRGGETS